MKTSPKDIFLHLVGIIALIASAISFLTIVFQCVNIFFPNSLDGYYSSQSAYSGVRWGISFLVVAFPVFVFVMRSFRKEYAENPEKRSLPIRKWLLYFALFIAALVILGDVVALLNNFLEGDLTARFIFKVLAVFFTAGAVFRYYIWELKSAEFTPAMKVLVYFVSAIALASIVTGFILVGSPAKERARKSDERRISELQTIQSEIIYYWQRKETLPNSLSDVSDSIRGFSVPKDPSTNEEYAYETTGDNSFTLCANFVLPSSETSGGVSKPMYGGGDFWEHDSGEVCFDKTIDKDLYPPLSPALPEIKR